MKRLSTIIEQLYQRYLPEIGKNHIIFDLDFADTTITISDPERLEMDLSRNLRDAIARAKNAKLSVVIKKDHIEIKDEGKILSKSACNLLCKEFVTVKSRVGFGNTVIIRYQG